MTGAQILGLVLGSAGLAALVSTIVSWLVFSSHPLTSAEGFAVARTPWRSVQMAAWMALASR